MNPLIKFWQYLVRPNPSITDVEERRQSQLLSTLLVVLVSSAVLTLTASYFRSGLNQTAIYGWLSLPFSAGIYYLNRSGRFKLAAYIYLAFNLILFSFMNIFVENVSVLYYSALVVIVAAILLPRWVTVVYVVSLVVLILSVIFVSVTTEITSFDAAIFVGFIGASILVLNNHRTNVERDRQAKLLQANEALRESEAELEKRVAARTRDLRLASDVARQITTVLDLDELLPHLVDSTKAAFNLHFVSIFLFDPETNRLSLVVGTDEAGQQMLDQGLGYDLEARPSLVAKAARDRQSVIINDVSNVEYHAQNPLLPNTKSEAGFPMIIADELIGVLGIQSEIPDRFGADDVEIFNILAEQIAIAVKNAQLFETQKRQAEALRLADQTKTQFLASMSHELRTPMNAIINFTEMVAMGMIGPVNEDQVDLLNQSLESSNYLLNLINDVLDITKIQAGKLTLFVEKDVDLTAELKTAVSMVEPLLSQKEVTLIQDIDPNLPIFSGDRRRIRQIALNLLTNAAKFTDKGSITLSAKSRRNEVMLVVSDTGPGISEDLQTIIFEPFMQTEDGLKHAEGTGLGLPITMSLVEAHGGRIWVESELGEGAAFYVSLPVQETSAVPELTV